MKIVTNSTLQLRALRVLQRLGVHGCVAWMCSLTLAACGSADFDPEVEQDPSTFEECAAAAGSDGNACAPVSAGYAVTGLDTETSEAGETAAFRVRLQMAPAASVTLRFQSNDTTEGVLDRSSLTFTTSNWATEQEVKLTGVQDALLDGPIAYTVAFTSTQSADAAYANASILPAARRFRNFDDDGGYWNGVTRTLPATPYGNRAAVSCHNCYHSSVDAAGLSPTVAHEAHRQFSCGKINKAIAAGADLIELDVDRLDGNLVVRHFSTHTNPVRLSEALACNADASGQSLRQANQLLFIEIKEGHGTTTSDRSFAQSLLTELTSPFVYPTAGRPVVIRAFDNGSHRILDQVKELLASDAFRSYAPFVRLQMLVWDKTNVAPSFLPERVMYAKNRGYDGIEFPIVHPNLFSGISFARLMGLGVNVFTLEQGQFPEIFVAALREEVDALTLDADDASVFGFGTARYVIKTENGAAYLNAVAVPAAATKAWYMRDTSAKAWFDLGGSAPSLLELTGSCSGCSTLGSALTFNGAQSVSFANAPNSSRGYLVNSVVRFDPAALELAEGATATIVANAEQAGFSLELYNPTSGPAVLRFGVRVNGSYTYATYPVKDLNTDQWYFVTGAYDTNGAVRLWVDSQLGVASGNIGGSVTPSAVSIRLGADPQSSGTPRSYFSGAVRQVSVLRWDDL